MKIVGILISADRTHICIETFSGVKTITLQRIAFPLRERVYNLHLFIILLFYSKRNRAFHTVQVVIQSGFRTNKKRGRYTCQMKVLCKRPFKVIFHLFDGNFRFTDGKRRAVALWYH